MTFSMRAKMLSRVEALHYYEYQPEDDAVGFFVLDTLKGRIEHLAAPTGHPTGAFISLSGPERSRGKSSGRQWSASAQAAAGVVKELRSTGAPPNQMHRIFG